MPEGDRIRQVDGTFHSMPGIGYHEVVIEHPRHDINIALMTVEDIAYILQVYRQRYQELRRDRRIEAIVIFKNHGAEAGTSLEHPHSQIAATPIVPTRLRYRLAEAVRYFDDMGECLVCRTLADELTSQERIICETDYFVAFIPYAALSPFHIWIFPRRHESSFDRITEEEIQDLGLMLKTTLVKLYSGLNNPDYNYVIQSVPTSVAQADYFHWYLSIVPRVSRAAGFEMGSGMYINTALPEESAAFLRGVEVIEY
jgi:UDPglucose--hexose-1-phosphate uridylyltransferase